MPVGTRSLAKVGATPRGPSCTGAERRLRGCAEIAPRLRRDCAGGWPCAGGCVTGGGLPSSESAPRRVVRPKEGRPRRSSSLGLLCGATHWGCCAVLLWAVWLTALIGISGCSLGLLASHWDCWLCSLGLLAAHWDCWLLIGVAGCSLGVLAALIGVAGCSLGLLAALIGIAGCAHWDCWLLIRIAGCSLGLLAAHWDC